MLDLFKSAEEYFSAEEISNNDDNPLIMQPITTLPRLADIYAEACKTIATRAEYPYWISWTELSNLLLMHVGRRTRHGPRRQDVALMRWVNWTPAAKTWAQSERCLMAPDRWPEFLLPHFKHRLIPTPYELANVEFHSYLAPKNAALKTYYYLYLFLMGFSLHEIEEAYTLSPEEVELGLIQAVGHLSAQPHYILWASATDFRGVPVPKGIRQLPMKEKGRAITILLTNPYALPQRYARMLVESPSYLAYLIYKSPKQPRLNATNTWHKVFGTYTLVEDS